MAKETTINDLARMIAEGFKETAKKADIDKRFEQVDEQFKQVDKRFERVDGQFEGVNGRLDNIDNRLLVIERDIAEIRSHFVYREEFEDLMARVKYLEKRLEIESGK
ncbi:MAG: hypothetical protein AAB491_01585 [Patescibacteria group bacterium]